VPAQLTRSREYANEVKMLDEVLGYEKVKGEGKEGGKNGERFVA
jgi:hypothetical protein